MMNMVPRLKSLPYITNDTINISGFCNPWFVSRYEKSTYTRCFEFHFSESYKDRNFGRLQKWYDLDENTCLRKQFGGE